MLRCCVNPWYLAAMLLTSVGAAPATGPSSPKDAYRSFAAAVEGGDAGAASKLWHVHRPAVRPLADVCTRQFIAYARLRRAVGAKIGRDAADKLPLNDAPNVADDKLTEEVRGDEAVVSWVDGGGTPREFEMIRVGGVWKPSLSPWIGSTEDADDVDAALAETATGEAEFVEKLERLVGEVEAGKVRTVNEVCDGLRGEQ